MGGGNDFASQIGCRVHQDLLGRFPVRIVGDARHDFIEHVRCILRDGVIDDDLTEEHRVGHQDVTPHGLFAADGTTHLVKDRVHRADVLHIADEAQVRELHAVAGADGAFERDQQPGGKTADRRLQRPTQDHPAEGRHGRAQRFQLAHAVRDGGQDRDDRGEDENAAQHCALNGRSALKGQPCVGHQGQQLADRQDGGQETDQAWNGPPGWQLQQALAKLQVHDERGNREHGPDDQHGHRVRTVSGMEEEIHGEGDLPGCAAIACLWTPIVPQIQRPS